MGATDEGPMPAFDGLSSTDLQTLLATLQQTNTQLGAIAQRIGNQPAGSLSNQTLANISGFANDAAAAAGGVPKFGLYINTGSLGGALVVRLT
jgi:hypothetical protein